MNSPGAGSREGPNAWTERLRTGGLTAGAAERVARIVAKAARSLQADTGGDPDFAFFVPGRIEVLGKHTDYAGGRSLLTAVERGFGFVGRSDPGGNGLRLLDAERGRALHVPLHASTGGAVRGWGLYPTTAVRRLVRDFPEVAGGASVAFASDLPPASGMSSSSALVVGTFLALTAGLESEEWSGLGGAPGVGFGASLQSDFAARDRLAGYLAAMEAGQPFDGVGSSRSAGPLPGVGAEGGSEDHTAILSARSGRVVEYSFLPTRFERATPLPSQWVFAVASSGVRAEKAGGAKAAYNRLAEETRMAARIWREETGRSEPHLGAVLASSPEARTRMEDILLRGRYSRLLARFRQFATESTELVPGTTAALAAGDMEAVGDLAARSQALAEEVLENQVPETSHLVASARELGAPAASAFGAGFGGAVWALAPVGGVASFLRAWRKDYCERFPEREGTCAFLSSAAGPAAFRIV